MFTLCGDLISGKKLDYTCRSSRKITGQTYGHTPYINRMEAIDILAVINRLDYFLLRYMLRERKLHDKTIDIRVIVETFYSLKQLGLGCIVFHANESGCETALLTRTHLMGHISLTTAIVSYKYGSQMRTFLTFSHHLLYSGCNLLFDFVGDFFAVNKCHIRDNVNRLSLKTKTVYPQS